MADYVYNEDFLIMLKEYQTTKNRKVFNTIGKIFLSIATNLLNKPCFIEYTKDRKDEMTSDATFLMVRYIDRYDVTKYNPFSYFTTVAWNAFLQNIKDYKKFDEIFKSLDYIEDMSFENNWTVDTRDHSII